MKHRFHGSMFALHYIILTPLYNISRFTNGLWHSSIHHRAGKHRWAFKEDPDGIYQRSWFASEWCPDMLDQLVFFFDIRIFRSAEEMGRFKRLD